MATDIVPGLGHGLAFTQAGVPLGYDAIDVRRALGTGLQEGVIDAGSYKVTQRAEGANLSVDIAASTGEGAWVKGDSVTAQGLYFIPPHTAKINEAIAAADASNPRNDIVVLEGLDDTHAAGGLNKSRVRVITGTPTAGAARTDAEGVNGTPARPASSLLLAVANVPALDTTIADAQVLDRRTWARGAYRRIERTSAPVVGSNTATEYRTTSTSIVTIDATNLKPRIECSGVPLRVGLMGTVGYTDATAATVSFALLVDGAESGGRFIQHSGSLASEFRVPALEWELVPAAGSHTIEPAWLTSAATVRLLADTSNTMRLVIKETVRQNASND